MLLDLDAYILKQLKQERTEMHAALVRGTASRIGAAPMSGVRLGRLSQDTQDVYNHDMMNICSLQLFWRF